MFPLRFALTRVLVVVHLLQSKQNSANTENNLDVGAVSLWIGSSPFSVANGYWR